MKAIREKGETEAVTQVTKDLSCTKIFFGFMRLGLTSVGGSGAWAYHIIVEKCKWLDEQEYMSLLALCQMLPGPSLVNLSVMIGERFQGARGSCAALLGLLGLPLCLVSIFAFFYDRFSEHQMVRDIFTGLSAAVAGLMIGTALRTIWRLHLDLRSVLFILLIFLGIGIFRWPLLSIILICAPLSVLSAIYWKKR